MYVAKYLFWGVGDGRDSEMELRNHKSASVHC